MDSSRWSSRWLQLFVFGSTPKEEKEKDQLQGLAREGNNINL